jgi:DNA-binding NarL/FixJ family response regulator
MKDTEYRNADININYKLLSQGLNIKLPFGQKIHIDIDDAMNNPDVILNTLLQTHKIKSCRRDLSISMNIESSSDSMRSLFSLFGASLTPPSSINDRKILFSNMEAKVLIYLLKGLPQRSIASILQRSVKTVSSHKINLMRKIGISNNMELYDLGSKIINLSPKKDSLVELSNEERRVLDCFLQTGSVQKSALLLGKSIKTVSTQKMRAMDKLGAHHDIALFAMCKNLKREFELHCK